MKRLLLVDDDAVLTRAYREWLSKYGFQVNTVGSGAGALSFLGATKPDLMVLDLMLSDVSGVDVLRFVRGQPRLEKTPVIVLSNEPRSDLGQYAARIGIQKAIRKDQCSPAVLMGAIDEILEPRVLAAARPSEPVSDPLDSEIESGVDRPAELVFECGIQNSECRMEMAEASRVEAKASFLADAPAICADLRELFVALPQESLAGPERQEHLEDLLFKVHFLVETAGLTGSAALAQATAVFKALVSALMKNPQRFGSSTLRTVENLVEVVGLLFQQARESGGEIPLSARVLVVDDDPAANETVVGALREAQLDACSTEDSLSAWQWINSEHFDLVLLRMEMPVLNGVQLCERLHRVQGYENTAVILIAARDDLENRARCASVGADDLIEKSILPQELVARVVGHLVGTPVQA